MQTFDKYCIPGILAASGVLAFSAFDVTARVNSLYVPSVHPFTATFVNIVPWVGIASFAVASMVALLRTSREDLGDTKSGRTVLRGYSVATVAVAFISVYVFYDQVAGSLKEFSERENGIDPESSDWIGIFSLLTVTLLTSALPVVLFSLARFLTKTYSGSAAAVEVELAGTLGLTGPRDPVNYAEKSDPASSRGAADDPLTRLALEQSDGHARLILKYYAQGYSQANLGFRYSLVFAVVGFIAILMSSLSLWFQNGGSVVPVSITGSVGGISGAVSFLFFRRADKGRELLMDLVDKLRTDRERELNVLRSLAQMDSFEDAELRDVLRTAATLQFLDSSITLDQLTKFVKSRRPPESAD
ncbi:hypothetical protein ACFQ0X_31095 [Streptomyces rectiviolaceus]|uniref:TRADD-N-associated membrane domain-containing protein n=1 Tax=Streptomyces rectiviolaceus TaxID=332591 RepID=UPI0031E2F426